MKSKIKKQNCYYEHPTKDHHISEYRFLYIDRKAVEYYECKICTYLLDKEIERQERIKKNEIKQREEADNLYWEKHRPKIQERERSQKEDLWDFEIRNELCKGSKLKCEKRRLYQDSIPKEVLQLTRATIKLIRLIDFIKKAPKERLKQEIEIKHRQEQEEIKRIEEERIKANTPLKKCITHGNLFLNDVIKSGQDKWTGDQAYKCRQCMKIYHKNHYSHNKEEILKKHAEYRKNNPEKVKHTRANWWRKRNGKNNNDETTAG